ncbi:MAG: TonB-dependent receptor [Gammaproteobacteria bacterium]|nr:TonB-dependent receptor [Gammaproteobacteria bacterium]
MESCQLRKLLPLAIVAAAISPFSAVQAQQSDAPVLEEITVTAAYREQGLQDVPISISAVTGDMMAQTAVQKAEDIQFLVPNFTLTETGIGTNAFIRGIGSGINQAFEQSVGTYVDGVHFGRAQQWRSPFLDIERVEVLRGPQSILFGKNSVAGALNITTAKPTNEFEGSFLVSNEFENNELIVEGVVSGPISDRVRYRVAARSRNLDGHMRNLTLSRDEPEREDTTVRGILEFDVSDNLTATLKAEFGEFDVTGRHIEIVNEQPGASGFTYSQILAGLFSADPSVLNTVQDENRSSNGDFSNNESENFVLTLDWAVGDFDLKSITAFSSFEYDEFCDCDFTGAFVFGAALQETYDQFSQEFRLSSPLGESFDYIAGLYYQTSDHDFADQIIVPGNSVLVPALGAPGALVANTQASRLADVENDVLSAFAQVNWHLSDAITLQVGGRVTSDERDGSRTLSIVDLNYDPLPAGQASAPFVYAQGFGITSTNLVAFSQSGVPQLFVPADAFLYYGFVDPFPGEYTMPCTAASDPNDCSGELGELPVDGSRDKTKFSPEVKLIFNAGDDALVYLSWSRGFKSGSFDFRANNKNFFDTMQESFEFDDEEATNFEIGSKFTLVGGALELSTTAFFTGYDDLQISIFDGVLGFNVGNAASADILGLEVDLRWAATDHLTIAGGFALTEFEFTDFENGQCYFGQPFDRDVNGDTILDTCSYTGNSNQMVSDLQGNVSFDYRLPVGSNLEFGALLDVFYTSEYDASATFDPALVQDSYSLFNARLGIGAADGRWQVAVLAKNLGDEKVLTFGGDTPLAGSNFGAKSNYAFYSPGRTVSLQGMLRF